jgi:hypothetical protein
LTSSCCTAAAAADDAIALFNRCKAGLQPDGIIMVRHLAACWMMCSACHLTTPGLD